MDEFQKEKKLEYLGEKLFSLHIYLSKIVFSISSASIIFSGTVLGLVENAGTSGSYLYFGWLFLILAVISQLFTLIFGFQYYYKRYENLEHNGCEFCNKTDKSEDQVIASQIISMIFWTLGTLLIAYFSVKSLIQ